LTKQSRDDGNNEMPYHTYAHCVNEAIKIQLDWIVKHNKYRGRVLLTRNHRQFYFLNFSNGSDPSITAVNSEIQLAPLKNKI